MMLFFPKLKTNNPQPDAIPKQKGWERKKKNKLQEEIQSYWVMGIIFSLFPSRTRVRVIYIIY